MIHCSESFSDRPLKTKVIIMPVDVDNSNILNIVICSFILTLVEGPRNDAPDCSVVPGPQQGFKCHVIPVTRCQVCS